MRDQGDQYNKAREFQMAAAQAGLAQGSQRTIRVEIEDLSAQVLHSLGEVLEGLSVINKELLGKDPEPGGREKAEILTPLKVPPGPPSSALLPNLRDRLAVMLRRLSACHEILKEIISSINN